MNNITLVVFLGLLAFCGRATAARGLEVTETGNSPSRKVSIVSPGVYKAGVSQVLLAVWYLCEWLIRRRAERKGA